MTGLPAVRLKYLITGACAAHGWPVGQRRGGRIVRVEHDRPAVPDLLGDQCLDVNQLAQVVDAVVAEMIGGDVRDDRDVGLVVAEARAG